MINKVIYKKKKCITHHSPKKNAIVSNVNHKQGSLREIEKNRKISLSFGAID